MKCSRLVGSLFIFFASFLLEAVLSQTENPGPNLETLKLVQLMFRHGDRVPEYPYPNDQYNESAWPEGWAQLTNEGKQQEYKLGQYLRTRYGNYLDASYKPNQIYAISSETDRTIMSGLLALAGLYPTNGESNNWDDQINWQPIPIRTIFTQDDNLIRFKRVCPRHEKLHRDLITNEQPFKKINEDNKEFFKTLTEYSGVNITTVNEIDSFYATLFIEDIKGKDIPDWAKALRTNENFQFLYNISYKAKTYTDELKRLRTGELTKFLVENFNERVRNESMKTKMFFISAHDITLIDALNTFGVLDLQRPYYSSVLILELHQNPSSGDYYVELHFRNDTTREPYKLAMPGCDFQFQCPLDKFVAYSTPLIPNDWDEECKLSQPEPTYNNSPVFTYILIGLGVIAVSVFLVGIVCMAVQKKRKNAYHRNEYQNF